MGCRRTIGIGHREGEKGRERERETERERDRQTDRQTDRQKLEWLGPVKVQKMRIDVT